jgi:benzoyl-CoA reductase/2-hydroxyglutaryl-CoA dehydratase subunit BcrC/BadD/HgdB
MKAGRTGSSCRSAEIKSTRQLKQIMKRYYRGAKFAKWSRKKVAWITSGGPVEPLIAMDVIPVYPENHGAMIGARKMGAELCERAEAMGYTGNLCSYARSDIACAPINGGPIGGLPKPDFLVCANNICGTVLKWYEIQARFFGVPLSIFDTPFIHTECSQEARQYVTSQVEEYIQFLQEVCKRKLSPARMQKAGKLSLHAQKLWQAVLDTAVAKPSPITAFDAFIHLAIIVTLRGTQTAVDYYRSLRDEMNVRVAQGIGVVPNEKYRFLWDNIPIWYRVRWLSEKFAENGASLVADTYSSAWSGTSALIDENDYLKSMALAYMNVHLNTSIDSMFQRIKTLIEKYDIDGVVMHSNRSCKPYSFGQYDLRKMIFNELKVPVLILEADMVDERNFSSHQIAGRIDTFMEMVK